MCASNIYFDKDSQVIAFCKEFFTRLIVCSLYGLSILVLVGSYFGFEDRLCVLIVTDIGYCLSFTFKYNQRSIKNFRYHL